MTETASTSASATGPYRGLTSYHREEDADFFFGRERECAEVISSLKARRMTLLYGESGVGKSSVLRAGVAASLFRDARETFAAIQTPDFVPVVFASWRDDPGPGLATAITSAVRDFARMPPPAHESRRLFEVIKAASDACDAYLLVLLDQFEEYFRYHRPTAASPHLHANSFRR